MIGNVEIQPQWIQNINTVCIVIGGPLLASLFTRMRGARLEDRHSATVRGFAVVDGDRVSDLAGRNQVGGR